MKLIKIGLANPDPTVGAFKTNTADLIAVANVLSQQDCTIVCFPEQSISGYPVEDMVLWEGFIAGQWAALMSFAEATKDLKTVFVLGVAVEYSSNAYNAAAVVHHGTVLGIVPKEKLPTYGVFYEKRTYSAGRPGFVAEVHGVPFGDLIFDFPFGKLGVEVCEDIWSPDGPLRRRAYSGAELIVNISASPYRAGVLGTRREMIGTRAADNLVTLVYVNQFGGNDGLAFDGGGFVNQCGRMLFESPRWCEGIFTTVVDLDRTSRQRRENTTWRTDREIFLRAESQTTVVSATEKVLCDLPSYPYPVPSQSFFIPDDAQPPNPRKEYFKDLVEAMLTGLDGYYRKTKAFQRIGIALSGGKDSVLTLLIAYLYAVRHPNREPIWNFIHCFSMPTIFNSELTKSIARDICNELNVGFTEISIAAEYGQALVDIQHMLSQGTEISRLGRQNVQARIRGKRMWDWTNATGGMWLQTGNMSEKAVGYTTIGGDMMGAYSLLGNVPKTVIIELVKYLNEEIFRSKALEALIASDASAELEEGQSDEQDLMPFPVLDACYALFVGEKMMPAEVSRVIAQMFPEHQKQQVAAWVARFTKLFRASIFKWVQAPESVHVGSLDLDRERALQLPVVQSEEWLHEIASGDLP